MSSPAFTARHDQIGAATHGLDIAALPVDDLLSAATWLDNFASGQANYGGMGAAYAGLLQMAAGNVLDMAALLVKALNAHQEV
jgi:hypothetical protein